MLSRVLFILSTFWVFDLAMAVEKIATVSPISFSLTRAMLEDIPIQVDYLPPKRLPMSRVPSWIMKNKTAKFSVYNAFVTISSVQPQFDFFNTLRQTNIRISKIDIATAMLPKGEKVTIHSQKEYFWLNSNNLLLMLGVLKRDLTLMWPKEEANINKNYLQLSATIRQLNLNIDSIVQANDIAFISSTNSKLAPLSASLSSDFVEPEEAKAIGLNFIYLSVNNKTKSKNIWVIDDFTRIKKLSLVKRLKENINNLILLF